MTASFKFVRRTAILGLLASGFFGCASQAVKPGNDFPTLARVEYVFECMEQSGGQNYDNLYHCVCALDKIAAQMPHEEFAQAQTFAHLFSLPGERGGEFRDPQQSSTLRNKLKNVTTEARAACFPEKPKSRASN
jgi:hypothetical protein